MATLKAQGPKRASAKSLFNGFCETLTSPSNSLNLAPINLKPFWRRETHTKINESNIGKGSACEHRILEKEKPRTVVKINPVLLTTLPTAIPISPLSFNSKSRVFWTSSERGKRVPKLVQFRTPCLKRFGSENGPQNSPKGL